MDEQNTIEQTTIDAPPSQSEPFAPLSESSAIDSLPLVKTDPKTHAQEAPPSSETPADTTSQPPPQESQPPVAKEPAETAPKSDLKPLFETQLDTKTKKDEPFKSESAEKILNEPVPSTLKGAAAKSFSDFKKKWAAEVESKDKEIHRLKGSQSEEAVTLRQEIGRLEKRVADLSGYESVIEHQSSEKFQSEYERPITQAEDGLIKFMEKAGATAEGLEELKRGIKDDRYLWAAAAELEKTNPGIAARFRFEINKIQDLRTKRDSAVDEIKTNHEKFLNERKTESAKRSAQFEEGLRGTIAQYSSAKSEDGTPSFPFLVKQRAPDGAPPELIRQVEAHNNMVEQNLAALDRVTRSDDPSERVRMAIGYMTAVIQGNVIADLRKQLEQANGLVGRVKKASAPPESSGSTAKTGTKQWEGSLSELADAQFGRGR